MVFLHEPQLQATFLSIRAICVLGIPRAWVVFLFSLLLFIFLGTCGDTAQVPSYISHPSPACEIITLNIDPRALLVVLLPNAYRDAELQDRKSPSPPIPISVGNSANCGKVIMSRVEFVINDRTYSNTASTITVNSVIRQHSIIFTPRQEPHQSSTSPTPTIKYHNRS